MPAGAWWACKTVGEIAFNFVQNIAIQLLTTGEISFKAALVGATVFAGLSLAHQGIQYAKNQRDTKLIQRTLNDAENKTKENYNRNKDPGEQVNDLKEIPDSGLKKHGVAASTRMTDGNEETTGTNHLERCKEQGASKAIPAQEADLGRAKTNLEKAQAQQQQAQDNLAQARNELNEQKIQAKVDAAASKLDMAQRKLDMTEKNVKRNEHILQQCQDTEQEIRENLKQYPDLKTREHPCAEPHALSQQKSDPSASRTHVTAGFERDIETKAERLVIRRPCEKCETVPGENLTTTPNMTEHLASKVPLPSGDLQPVLDYSAPKSRRQEGVANPPEEKDANDDRGSSISSADETAELLSSEEDSKQTDNKIAKESSKQPSAEASGQRILRTFHGTFLRAPKVENFVNQAQVALGWEHWYVEDCGGKVAFKAIHSPDRFIRANPDGHIDLAFGRPDTWEQWLPCKNSDDSWSFLGFHGRWLSAKKDGSTTTVPKCDTWEHFWLERW